MAQLGEVNEFVLEKETVPTYLECVSDVPENEEVPVLLSTGGAKTYTPMRKLATSGTLKDDFLPS